MKDKATAIRNKIAKAEKELKVVLKNTLVKCTGNCFGKGCGKKTVIRKLDYIQTHWYVRPYSCNGGDYWKEGEGQFRCPKCGQLNRLYDRPEIQELKYHFNTVIQTYDDK